MSLKLKDFAKSDAGSENVSRGTVDDSSEDEISYLPPGSFKTEGKSKPLKMIKVINTFSIQPLQLSVMT